MQKLHRPPTIMQPPPALFPNHAASTFPHATDSVASFASLQSALFPLSSSPDLFDLRSQAAHRELSERQEHLAAASSVASLVARLSAARALANPFWCSWWTTSHCRSRRRRGPRASSELLDRLGCVAEYRGGGGYQCHGASEREDTRYGEECMVITHLGNVVLLFHDLGLNLVKKDELTLLVKWTKAFSIDDAPTLSGVHGGPRAITAQGAGEGCALLQRLLDGTWLHCRA